MTDLEAARKLAQEVVNAPPDCNVLFVERRIRELARALLDAIEEVGRLRGALVDAADTMEWLAENQPDCLGWVGHDQPDGPWPEIKERAANARSAASKAMGSDS